LDLHSSAAGKAVLATLPEESREEWLQEADLVAHTDQTATTTEALRDELESIRDRGLAFDRAEHFDGLHCVAAPVRIEQGPLGAVSVSTPAGEDSMARLEDTLSKRVHEAAKTVEMQIGYGTWIDR
jgi:DNA-binding IclR family transcriptional regulator